MDYVLVLLLAILFLWLGIRQFKINQKRMTEGVIVKAKVIRIVEYPRQRGEPYYRPVVEFITQKGDTINAELENSGKSQYSIGEEMEVVYHPDNPNQATITVWSANNVSPIAFMIAGVLMLVVFIFKVLR